HDDRLVFDGNIWSIRPATGEWAVLELLASGPNPRRHRIVELAARRGERAFHAFVAADKAVPRLLRKLGVPETDDRWLPMHEAAASLLEFLGGATVLGFSYVPAFLEQLLGPAWPAVDLLQLLYRLTYFSGRPDPARLARHFGLEPPRSRRPEAMLPFSSALFEHLRGDRALQELRQLGAPRASQRPPLPGLPSGPGVYVMSSAEAETLYVGKSVDLERRVGSYFGQPIAESRGLYQLANLAEHIEIIAVHSELEALLLEAHLIQELEPRFNIQRLTHERCRYLRLTVQEPFPMLTVSPAPADDGATYFGPFQHAAAADRLRQLLTGVLRLRTCTRQLPAKRKPLPACSKAAAGTCLAPCVTGPPPASYDAEVRLARQLLTATPEEFRRLLLGILRQRPPNNARARQLKRPLEGLVTRSRTVAGDTALWD
ncbi:MAG TPA: GIY-YIG nuclease family protein, partial [Chloroflexota bacterium]|nr:GIY-YIG nuclease family protein [Chloroflexota bacterium]